MAALLVLLAVAILVLVAVWAVRRRSDDEVHSVEGYRHALTTLEEVRARTGGAVRPIRPSAEDDHGLAAAEGSTGRLGSAPGAGVEGRSGPLGAAAPAVGGLPPSPTPRRIPEPLTAAEFGIEAGEHLVFGDPRAEATDPVPLVVDTGSARTGVPGRSRRTGRARTARRRPSRIGVWAAAAAVVVVLAGAGAYVATRTHGGRSAAQASGTSGAAHPRASVPRTSAPAAPTTSAPSRKAKPSGAKRTTPTTTVPSALTPQSPTSTGATYTVPAGTYAVTMSATTGPCWMQVTSASTGQTLFAGTVHPGQQQRVQTTGASSIVIGAVSGTVQVNGTPASLPSGFLTPFTLRLQPS